MKRLLILLCIFGCDDAAQPPPGPAGYDEAIDPQDLVAQESKADSVDCGRWDEGTEDGASMLALVNKTVFLKGSFAPADILPLSAEHRMPGRDGMLRAGAWQAFAALHDAAFEEKGFDLRVRSAYRGFRNQCFTYNYWVEQKGAEHAGRFSARPGRSQHQLGTTVDITAETWGWKIEPWVAETDEAAWLFGNAHRFGFALSYPEGAEDLTGYAFEPWHYRYIGIEAAAELAGTEHILETYLQACRDGDERLTCPDEIQPEVPVNHLFIGGQCAEDADCASLGEKGVCLLEGHPEGHCTIPCTRGCPDRVGNNQTTFCHEDLDGDAWCRSKCDFDRFETGCRGGYACLDGARPNGAGTADVCLPDVSSEG